jgi:hypothetical protein
VGIVRPDLPPDLARDPREGEQVARGVVEMLGRGRDRGLDRCGHPGELLPDGVGVGLVEHRADHRGTHGRAVVGTVVRRLRR